MRLDRNFVSGQFVEPATDELIPVYNPATEALIAQVSGASKAEAVAAVEAAAAAQKGWRKLPSAERGAYLHKLADALTECAPAIGAALALESGKSVADATNEAIYAGQITRYHAEWARRVEGEVIPSDSPDENLVLHREPIGVVACLIPFNFPVYTLMRKIAPALITGNTVVVRPSNNTPTSAFEIARAVEKAGVGTPYSIACTSALRQESWYLFNVLLKKSSTSRLWRAGFLAKASRILPRKRLRMMQPPRHISAIPPRLRFQWFSWAAAWSSMYPCAYETILEQ